MYKKIFLKRKNNNYNIIVFILENCVFKYNKLCVEGFVTARVVAILIYLLDTNLIPRRSHLLAFMVCNYSLLYDFENIKCFINAFLL